MEAQKGKNANKHFEYMTVYLIVIFNNHWILNIG